MQLSLGFSPCPNDTFMFNALINHKLDKNPFDFNLVIEDVEFECLTLNVNSVSAAPNAVQKTCRFGSFDSLIFEASLGIGSTAYTKLLGSCALGTEKTEPSRAPTSTMIMLFGLLICWANL